MLGQFLPFVSGEDSRDFIGRDAAAFFGETCDFKAAQVERDFRNICVFDQKFGVFVIVGKVSYIEEKVIVSVFRYTESEDLC